MKIRFYAAANHRLDEIWHYSVEQWDEVQAEKYLRGLFQAVEGVSARRFLWKPVQEAGFAGVFYFRYERHFIFFRELGGGDLGVLTILSDRMDLPRRLLEDGG